MARITKKQQQERLLEQFLRRLREAPSGVRVYMAVGDLFKSAEVRDLDAVRTAGRGPVVRSDEGEDGS